MRSKCVIYHHVREDSQLLASFQLFPGVRSVRVLSVTEQDDGVHVVLNAIKASAKCPVCSRPSRRVHSHYRRTVADLPWSDRRTHLHLRVRRFFCTKPDCARRVFAERLPDVVAAYKRSTVRLDGVHRKIAMMLGGQAGGRLTRVLAMPASGDTLLRRIQQASLVVAPSARVVGVDDWALRKGMQYGTLICDLERRQPIEMLPGRSAEALCQWLKENPQVEVVSRDRAEDYARGAAEGAPQAVQVADRWHLLKNLHDALRRVVDRHHQQIEEAANAVDVEQQKAQPEPIASSEELLAAQKTARSAAASELSQQRRARRLQRYEQVMQLHQQGIGQREIARRMGIHRSTVRRFIRTGSFPERATTRRSRAISRYDDYLARRWNEGCTVITELHKELKKLGFSGSYHMVRRRVAHWRDSKTDRKGVKRATKRLSSRSVCWLLLKAETDLHDADASFVERLEACCPDLKRAAGLARSFWSMVCERQSAQWSEWLTEAANPAAPVDMRRFASSLKADEAAVKAALSLPWSNGQLEGQINRLKTLKRQMYGRASFHLLRQRFLLAA